jgi:hypothetical protein
VVDAVGEEGHIGRHPFGENADFLWSDAPEVHGYRVRKGFMFKGREGYEVRETLTSWVKEKREPKRS